MGNVVERTGFPCQAGMTQRPHPASSLIKPACRRGRYGTGSARRGKQCQCHPAVKIHNEYPNPA